MGNLKIEMALDPIMVRMDEIFIAGYTVRLDFEAIGFVLTTCERR
jgi:hypothetical protein